jgi:hypothetical protein
MKRTLYLFPVLAVLTIGCIHGGSFRGGDERTMYYAYPVKDVFAAAQVVLKEQDYRLVEINPTEKVIKAVKDSTILGPISVLLTFREEGSGTWIDLSKKVPPKFIPGSTANSRMDVDDLFRYVDMELERNH